VVLLGWSGVLGRYFTRGAPALTIFLTAAWELGVEPGMR
jgi:hypothetical protein